MHDDAREKLPSTVIEEFLLSETGGRIRTIAGIKSQIA